MRNWFLGKVKYEKIVESGKQKKVTEEYLVDAWSYTEAEARFIEYIKPFISGEYSIDLRKYKCSEIFFNENGDRYYKVKTAFITLDERTGAEKSTNTMMLVQASSIEEAKKVHEEGMKGTLADFVVRDIVETKIMDVVLYNPEEN